MIHNSNLPLPADVIPHRPPRLWISGVTELDPGIGAKGFWIPGDTQFEGHFDGAPVLQGVQQLEALAQLGGYAIMAENPGRYDVLLLGADASFSSPVLPQDILLMEVEIIEKDRRTFAGRATSRVGEEVTCEALVRGSIMKAGMLHRMLDSVRQKRSPDS